MLGVFHKENDHFAVILGLWRLFNSVRQRQSAPPCDQVDGHDEQVPYTV